MSNLKKTIVSMLAGLTITKAELVNLKKVFNKLDVDKNGRLSM
jgi:Ca2+-binding EF-hand superfamily protein